MLAGSLLYVPVHAYLLDRLLHSDQRLQSPKPGPFVAEVKDSALYYTNRVLKEFRDKCVLRIAERVCTDWYTETPSTQNG